MKPFFGYPGGKSRSIKNIKSLIDFVEPARVVEPFCGGGSFSLSCKNSWVNDIDADLMCVWLAIRDHVDDFIDTILETKVEAEDFYTLQEKILKFRPMPVTKKTLLQRAVEKFLIHKISYSNMGEKSGSPVGGRGQTGAWKFDCRLNYPAIEKNLRKISEHIQGWEITNLNFWQVLEKCKPSDFVFMDPPYYVAGPKCYKHGTFDHTRLATELTSKKFKWALTYDSHPDIFDLYEDFANIADLKLKYWMSSAYRKDEELKKVSEFLITKK